MICDITKSQYYYIYYIIIGVKHFAICVEKSAI